MCAEIIDSGSNREHLARELTAPWVVRNDFGSVEVRLQLHGECGQNRVTRRTDGGKSISSNNMTTRNNNTKTLKKFSLGPLQTGEEAGLLEIALATLTVSCALLPSGISYCSSFFKNELVLLSRYR